MKTIDMVESISANLLTLGVCRGGVLMVHSSLKSLGWVPQGAETVIQALSKALGEDGTLLMPALTYESVRFDNPVFDLNLTPACVGVIPEFFRTRPGSLRSMHPTHSVCGIGPLAEELIFPHQYDSTPCGPNSPFHRLTDYDGQILMLGCGLRPNTSMHAIEELVEPPYLFGGSIIYTLIDQAGEVYKKEYTRHNFFGWIQRYDRVAEILDAPHLRVGKIRAATAYLIDSKALKTAALSAMQKDPLFFVDQIYTS